MSKELSQSRGSSTSDWELGNGVSTVGSEGRLAGPDSETRSACRVVPFVGSRVMAFLVLSSSHDRRVS